MSIKRGIDRFNGKLTSDVRSIELEMKIDDAMHRIKHVYEETEGKVILSFSGGKDSTVVAELMLLAEERGIIPKNSIKVLFADTKVEYDATYNFVEWFSENKRHIEYLQPRKPFGQVLKEYGKPAISKMKSQFLGTYKNSDAYRFYYMKNMLQGKPVVCGDVLVEQPELNLQGKRDANLYLKYHGKKTTVEDIQKELEKRQEDRARFDFLEHRNIHKSVGELVYGTFAKKYKNSYYTAPLESVVPMFEDTYKHIPEYSEYTMENDLKNGANLMEAGYRAGNLVTGERMKTIDGQAYNSKRPSKERLANKHMHFLHPEIDMKFSSKCCDFTKKYPFYDYYKENGTLGYITGIRVGEGGARAMAYKSCTSVKKINGVEMMHKMPIWDWKEEDVELFIDSYDVKVSDAYTVYGLERTGCIGCPFAKNLTHSLKVLHDFEPKKYKAVMHWLKDVYLLQFVELRFDPDYTAELNEVRRVNEVRRYQMMKMFREDVAYKWEPSEFIIPAGAIDLGDYYQPSLFNMRQ